MSDITKCANGVCCELKNTCWRWVATANPIWQSYADFYCRSVDQCENYRQTLPELEKGDLK